jgi:hypothetical protein
VLNPCHEAANRLYTSVLTLVVYRHQDLAMRGMLNSAKSTRPLRLQPILCPLPAALGILAAVAADPQDPHVSTGVGALGPATLRSRSLVSSAIFRRSSDSGDAALAIRQVESSSKITGSKKKA